MSGIVVTEEVPVVQERFSAKVCGQDVRAGASLLLARSGVCFFGSGINNSNRRESEFSEFDFPEEHKHEEDSVRAQERAPSIALVGVFAQQSLHDGGVEHIIASFLFD